MWRRCRPSHAPGGTVVESVRRLVRVSVYLDHAATTPMLPEATRVLAEQLALTGNPSSLHASGRAARRVVEESREQLAAALGARPSEVVWTAGGTEADNLAVKGLFWAPTDRTTCDDAGSWCPRSSTTRCSIRRSGWPSTRAPSWSSCRWTPTGCSTSTRCATSSRRTATRRRSSP